MKIGRSRRADIGKDRRDSLGHSSRSADALLDRFSAYSEVHYPTVRSRTRTVAWCLISSRSSVPDAEVPTCRLSEGNPMRGEPVRYSLGRDRCPRNHEVYQRRTLIEDRHGLSR